MSCCGGKCGCDCGVACKCRCGCGGCKMNADLTEGKSTTTVTMVLGVAPQKGGFDVFEMAYGAENGGCKCGSNCTCDHCNCK